METQSIKSLYRLLSSLPDQGPGDNGSGGAEPLTSQLSTMHWGIGGAPGMETGR